MTDDRDVDDPALGALLRAHSQETPPPGVDAAILAAAHCAVASAPHAADRAPSTPAWRWWMPLAAAATIAVVAIGVLPLAPTDTDSKRLAAPEKSTADAAATSPPPAPAASSLARPALAPAAPSSRESAAAGASVKADAPSDVGTPHSAEWIARIRALRDEGRIEEAAQELARFRAAFTDADARLPADLRPWADSLRR